MEKEAFNNSFLHLYELRVKWMEEATTHPDRFKAHVQGLQDRTALVKEDEENFDFGFDVNDLPDFSDDDSNQDIGDSEPDAQMVEVSPSIAATVSQKDEVAT